MLVRLANTPRDYAWGSTRLISDLQGRQPGDAPEAEVWFGDHPDGAAVTGDGTPLNEWLAARGHEPLPYLLKLLAASHTLSIQAHPSKAQAEVGFAAEEAAGVPRDASHRVFRDDNHKPEIIVALSDPFVALAGLRELAATRRLFAALGPAGDSIRHRLDGTDDETALREIIGWLLSGEASDDVTAITAALGAAESDEFAAELAVARRVATQMPGDAGVAVALLMNTVVLRPGEALFTPAGVLHAYQEGLGVELMAASDNVLRGGLTPKHVDVARLIDVLDAAPGAAPLVVPERVDEGIERFHVGVSDFVLWRVTASAHERTLALSGPAIVLATRGSVTVMGEPSETLRAGQALLVIDQTELRWHGDGEAYVAVPGEPRDTP